MLNYLFFWHIFFDIIKLNFFFWHNFFWHIIKLNFFFWHIFFLTLSNWNFFFWQFFLTLSSWIFFFDNIIKLIFFFLTYYQADFFFWHYQADFFFFDKYYQTEFFFWQFFLTYYQAEFFFLDNFFWHIIKLNFFFFDKYYQAEFFEMKWSISDPKQSVKVKIKHKMVFLMFAACCLYWQAPVALEIKEYFLSWFCCLKSFVFFPDSRIPVKIWQRSSCKLAFDKCTACSPIVSDCLHAFDLGLR